MDRPTGAAETDPGGPGGGPSTFIPQKKVLNFSLSGSTYKVDLNTIKVAYIKHYPVPADISVLSFVMCQQK